MTPTTETTPVVLFTELLSAFQKSQYIPDTCNKGVRTSISFLNYSHLNLEITGAYAVCPCVNECV